MTAQPPESDEDRPADHPQQISGTLNYLRWLEADDQHNRLGLQFNAETALEWFCQTLPHRPLLDVLRRRYAQLAGLDSDVFFFPTEHPALVEKVLIPLHQAKVAFVLGHEFGCIAMCGLVGEMLSIVRFEMSRNTLTKAQQKRLLGREVEQIDHARRTGFLELMGMLDAATADLFNELRKLRNKYLHHLSHPHTTMPKDAARAYEIAAKLVAIICGLGVSNGRVTISPELLAFIKRGGLSGTESKKAD